MRYWKRIVTTCAALMLFAAPAWAHPSATPHAHSEELVPLLAAAVGLGAVLLLRRSRSRAG